MGSVLPHWAQTLAGKHCLCARQIFSYSVSTRLHGLSCNYVDLVQMRNRLIFTRIHISVLVYGISTEFTLLPCLQSAAFSTIPETHARHESVFIHGLCITTSHITKHPVPLKVTAAHFYHFQGHISGSPVTQTCIVQSMNVGGCRNPQHKKAMPISSCYHAKLKAWSGI